MKRFKHNLSNYQLTTGDLGSLYPVGWYEAIPGDTFQQRTSALIRFSPQIHPVMHPVTIRFHSFFVPNRLIWNTKIGDSGDFEDFITGGPDGNDSQVVPSLTSTGTSGDLLDHLGVPPVVGIDVSSLPVRAFNLIVNEYYRDQDLQSKRDLEDLTIPQISWEKDYFSSARPWTQKGFDVTIPLGDRAPIASDGPFDGTGSDENLFTVFSSVNDGNRSLNSTTSYLSGADQDYSSGNGFNLYADLSEAASADVNDFRRAFALQRYQEARARYGSRYTEYLAYLGIKASDQRLQRPEYLGGSKQIVSFSEVVQTQRTDEGQSPLGNLAGHGIAAMRSNRWRRFIPEHGIIITLMSARPKSIYNQGVPRKFLRRDKEDFFQKELMQIGQQPVYNEEIYAADNNRSVFGYQDRYSEYKMEMSGVSNEFRDILNDWHLAREFQSPPVLNSDFVSCNPSKRIFAEQTQNSMWCMINHSIQARRMIPKSSASRII